MNQCLFNFSIYFTFLFVCFLEEIWVLWSKSQFYSETLKDSGTSASLWLTRLALPMGRHGFTPSFPLPSPWTSRLSTSCCRENVHNSPWDDTETRCRFNKRWFTAHWRLGLYSHPSGSYLSPSLCPFFNTQKMRFIFMTLFNDLNLNWQRHFLA